VAASGRARQIRGPVRLLRKGLVAERLSPLTSASRRGAKPSVPPTKAVTQLIARPPPIDRSRVEGVDRDRAMGQVVGEGCRPLLDSALPDRIGQLIRHRSAMLTRGEKENAPVRPSVLMTGRERLHEERRGARVDRERKVQLFGAHGREVTRRGDRVVSDQDVDSVQTFVETVGPRRRTASADADVRLVVALMQTVGGWFYRRVLGVR
jgi:hypothetical protein